MFDDYRITSPYGYRTHPIYGGQHFHSGIDLAKGHRTPIKAFTSGHVIYAGFGRKGTGFGGYGNVVFIRDKYGKGHLYAHLSEVSVRKGQQVSEGEKIGLQGNTGLSTGSHLHYEVRNKAESHIPYGWRVNKEKHTFNPGDYLKSIEKEILVLPSYATKWRVYPLDKQPVVGNEKAFIKPAKFGGLEYEILGYPYPNVATIQTRDFGKVNIYVAKETGAQIKGGK